MQCREQLECRENKEKRKHGWMFLEYLTLRYLESSANIKQRSCHITDASYITELFNFISTNITYCNWEKLHKED